jgi:hypothetical protein
MKKIVLLILWIGISISANSQDSKNLEDVQPGRFDQGKMWTFENAPVDYFKEAYNFDATDEWLEDARKSALRFGSWCSGSFISENGLILTNHHCSRGVAASVMNPDENFDENGFYAEDLTDERRVKGLFVDQLIMVADVTKDVEGMSEIPADSALRAVVANLKASEEWRDLIIETRTFYSGGRYSVYGFKRYSDIRLVLYPELALGYFGGDADNFTYPRYNLDFTLWRAYDDDGNPLQPTNYFEFKEEGASEDELVFIIGNPGSTGRYLTMAQLYYQRDVSAPAILSYLQNRMDILLLAADEIDDIYKKDSVVNLAFGLSNSNKAYKGRLDGLNDPYLMKKKEKKEQQVRSNVAIEGTDPWQELETAYQEYGKYYAETLFLSRSGGVRGKVSRLIFLLADYKKALEEENDLAKLKSDIDAALSNFDMNLEKVLFTAMLQELSEHSQMGYMDGLLAGSTPKQKAEEVISTSLLLNNSADFYKLKAKKLDKEPLIAFADIIVPMHQEAVARRREIAASTRQYEEQIMNLQFGLSGLTSPPDATFSLRIADGIVKGYEYNGTTAPVFTTYYGLYNRHYSHNQKYPWDLPEKWLDPPTELLKAPLNFVCTADIIGGNSGSPVINANQEVVGLVFDGNIESLPGYFIYDNTYNRTVSVHSGGIAAALRYIYKADRILDELK